MLLDNLQYIKKKVVGECQLVHASHKHQPSFLKLYLYQGTHDPELQNLENMLTKMYMTTFCSC